MDKHQDNVPRLRFPEFIDEWRVRKLSQLLRIGSGQDYKHLKSGDIPVYGTGGIMLYVNDYLHDGKSIGIGRKGTIDKPQFLSGKFWTVDTLFYTYGFKESVPEFLYAIFQRINWQKWNEASGVPSLSKTTVENIKVVVPGIGEQQKIASFLTAVDQRITNQQQKLSLLKDYKKGVMQKIFTQQIRFKDENGEAYPGWEERKLGDVAYSETSSLSANQIEQRSGRYKVYGASGVLQTLDTYHHPDEYIAIVKDGAGVGRISFCEPKSSVLGTMIVIQPKEIVQKKFLYYQLHLVDFKKYTTGSTIPHIYFNQYSREKFVVPRTEEQQKIATFLSAVDDKIKSEEAMLAFAKNFKKSLLQKMFV